VPSLFELPLDTGVLSGGAVGMTVTVLTTPVTVWSDWIGVGVHVEDWLPVEGMEDCRKLAIESSRKVLIRSSSL
jgi:hypothetical protein